MKAVVKIELIRLIIHSNDGEIAEAIESAGSRIERLSPFISTIEDRMHDLSVSIMDRAAS